MIEGGWYPCSSTVACLAVGAELRCRMRRIVGVVVIGLVAAHTGIRGGGIIPVVALVAAGGNMCAGERPVGIVNCKCGGFPARVCRMAICTGRRDVCCLVGRVCAGVIIGLVAAHTGIRGRGIISVMTAVAIHRGMSAREGIVIIVNGERGRFPSRDRRMAVGTTCRYVGSLVIRVRAGIVIWQMTGDAIFGKAAEGAVRMATGAIEGMALGQREKRVVNICGIPGDAVY